MEIDIYKALFAAAVGVISWFLKSLITDVKNEVKELENRVATNSTSIEVLKSGQNALSSNIEEIKNDVKEIGLYIRNLNHKQHE